MGPCHCQIPCHDVDFNLDANIHVCGDCILATFFGVCLHLLQFDVKWSAHVTDKICSLNIYVFNTTLLQSS